MAGKALEGVKVLEFASFVTGAYCTKLLADLGAEVIKIEEPQVGDEARRRGPFPNDIPHPERSGLFLYLNTNKLGITLDLKTPTGKRIFFELVGLVDILVADKPPKVMEELGLTYEALKGINPRLVMTSITPFGETGPYRDYKGYHLNLTHASGAGYLMPASTSLERAPLKGGGHFDEYACGLSAAIATLGALYWQRATGSGQHIDASKQDMIMDMDKVMITAYPNTGTIGRRVSAGAGPGPIPCKDGHIMVLTLLKPQWEALLDAMGNPEWAEKFTDDAYRDEHMQELQARMAEWTKNQTKEQAYHKLQQAGCPAGVVRSAEEVVNWEQPNLRGFFVEVDHPKAGRLKYPTAPYRLSRTPVAIERPAPLLGQHNEEMYCGRLGYTKQELVRMRQAGVI